jgi:hypothetical protein
MLINSIITALADLLKTISYDNSTLGTLGLVKTYEDQELDKYGSEIQVYLDALESRIADNATNQRNLSINIDIWCDLVGKQEQGVANSNELTEKVLEKLEKFLPKVGSSIPNPNNIHVNNNLIKASKLKVADGKALRRITFEVFEFVSTF